eukprot:TRINITY_DN222_c0_g1_i1.p2 TRINITY_DN222_c0_g1~~TRINITY_DN222_c0_g1_i1.p2  ORF type:complete len:147 (-),score=27.50 TRINITY_DN222_c0_g1_i1:10-450(-)
MDESSGVAGARTSAPRARQQATGPQEKATILHAAAAAALVEVVAVTLLCKLKAATHKQRISATEKTEVKVYTLGYVVTYVTTIHGEHGSTEPHPRVNWNYPHKSPWTLSLYSWWNPKGNCMVDDGKRQAAAATMTRLLWPIRLLEK